MKKIVLLAFALVLLSTALSLFVVGLLELQTAYASPYTSIDVDTAYDMITNGSYPALVVLDVRTQSEYDDGHIYGAVWIPVSELEARIGELAGHENHEIIVYCLSGGRSATASGILDSHNFTKVYNMLGGITAWQSKGYPVYIATVHNVDTTFNYDTIQAAIDAPQTSEGHTILVEAGTYYEHVTVDKSVSLIGENRNTTKIDGNVTGTLVYVNASNVNVSGFTIQNSGKEWLDSGIYLESCTGCNISGNIVADNRYGIYLDYYTSLNSLSNNIIINNEYSGIILVLSSNNTLLGNALHNNNRGVELVSSSRIFLSDNVVTNNSHGISLWESFNNSLVNNIITNNYYEGVHLDSSSNNNTLSMNTITNSYHGIFTSGSSNNSLSKNIISNNRHGVYLYESSNNNMVSGNNVATNNEYGIVLFESLNNHITANNITNNGSGIFLDDSDSNTIVDNNLTNNDEGLNLKFSGGNTLRNNNIANNRWNFAVSGSLISEFDNDIDASNLVDGKSIHHLVNQSNLMIDSSTFPDVGYLGIVNSENITVKDLSLTKNAQGVLFAFTSYSTIENVNVSKNWVGIQFWESNINTVISNMISNNSMGIILDFSDSNTIYNNNFINNEFQAGTYESYSNLWDDGYPSGGNYWSNYTGVDSDHDGIGDSSHILDADNQDNYPLMGMFSDFNATSQYHTQTICNSSISDFQFNGTAICFTVIGGNGTGGFCRICIPRALMNETYTVFVNGTEVPFNLLPCSNSTHSYLYFTYNHSTQEVIIIPEFPTWTSMLLILIVLTVVIAIYKRRLLKTPIP